MKIKWFTLRTNTCEPLPLERKYTFIPIYESKMSETKDIKEKRDNYDTIDEIFFLNYFFRQYKILPQFGQVFISLVLVNNCVGSF